MENATQQIDDRKSTGWRTWLPGILLCFLIAMSAVFYGGGVEAFYGPTAAERENKKQEFMTNRNRLLLLLSTCRNYETMKNDGYICGGSAMVYKSLASSLDCRIAEEAAKELGIDQRTLSIPSEKALKPSSGS